MAAQKVVRIKSAPVNGKKIFVKPVAEDELNKFTSIGHSYVPHKSIADTYVNRDINGKPDFEVYEKARKKKRNVLISGPTGSGKTKGVMAYAAANDLLFYDVPCDVGITPADLFGKMMPTGDPDIPFRWVDGPVTTIFREGGVLLISEINMIPPKIAGSLYSLLDARRHIVLMGHDGEIVPAHPDLLIVADMNLGYIGTQQLNPALQNRFQIRATVGYDANVEKELVVSKALLRAANKLRTLQEIRTPVSTNMLIEYVELAMDFDIGFARINFVEKFAPSEMKPVADAMDLFSVEIEREIDRAKAALPEYAVEDAKPAVKSNGATGYMKNVIAASGVAAPDDDEEIDGMPTDPDSTILRAKGETTFTSGPLKVPTSINTVEPDKGYNPAEFGGYSIVSQIHTGL